MASNSAGVVGAGIEPCAINFFLTSGISKTLAMSWLTLLRIAGGVPAAASTPNQDSYLYSGRVSAMVGISGSWGTRLAELIAIALTLPVALRSLVAGIGAMYNCASPRMTAVVASGAPL